MCEGKESEDEGEGEGEVESQLRRRQDNIRPNRRERRKVTLVMLIFTRFCLYKAQ